MCDHVSVSTSLVRTNSRWGGYHAAVENPRPIRQVISLTLEALAVSRLPAASETETNARFGCADQLTLDRLSLDGQLSRDARPARC